MPNPITDIPAAASDRALAHFSTLLEFETDCWDTHAALEAARASDAPADFVVLDVRAPALFEAGHVPGAQNLPHGKMTAHRMAEFPAGITFVVYCAGPHCNGADKAAVRLARLGLPVKRMIGGVTGWIDEGFDLASGA